MLNYLLQNWIAIVALIISLVSLVIGIVTRREAKQVQLEEKYSELRIKNHKLTIQANKYEEKFNHARKEHIKAMKSLSQLVNFLKETSNTNTDELVQHMQYFVNIGKAIDEALKTLANVKKATDSDLFENVENIKSLHILTQLDGRTDYMDTTLKTMEEIIITFEPEIERIYKILENPDYLKALEAMKSRG